MEEITTAAINAAVQELEANSRDIGEAQYSDHSIGQLLQEEG